MCECSQCSKQSNSSSHFVIPLSGIGLKAYLYSEMHRQSRMWLYKDSDSKDFCILIYLIYFIILSWWQILCTFIVALPVITVNKAVKNINMNVSRD